jgi:GTP cyclohydrolase II
LIASNPFKLAGASQAKAYEKAGFSSDARSFRPAGEILADLRVGSIILLTSSPDKADSIRNAGINVSGTRGLGELS